MLIDIMAVTYHQDASLKCFINSMKAQAKDNWRLQITHDGRDDFFRSIEGDLIMNGYLNDSRIAFDCTDKRYNDWGHTLRSQFVKSLKNRREQSDWLILTNADNYYAPLMTEFVETIAENKPNVEFIYWDCVHSHHLHRAEPPGNYGLLRTTLEYGGIDMGCAAIRTDVAIKTGFNHRTFDADWQYFYDVMQNNKNLKTHKLNKILLVHN